LCLLVVALTVIYCRRSLLSLHPDSFSLTLHRAPTATLFPYATLFRSLADAAELPEPGTHHIARPPSTRSRIHPTTSRSIRLRSRETMPMRSGGISRRSSVTGGSVSV